MNNEILSNTVLLELYASKFDVSKKSNVNRVLGDAVKLFKLLNTKKEYTYVSKPTEMPREEIEKMNKIFKPVFPQKKFKETRYISVINGSMVIYYIRDYKDHDEHDDMTVANIVVIDKSNKLHFKALPVRKVIAKEHL